MLTYQWLLYFAGRHPTLYLAFFLNQELAGALSDQLVNVLSSITYTILNLFSAFDNNEVALENCPEGKVHMPLFQPSILEELFCAALHIFYYDLWQCNRNVQLRLPDVLSRLSGRLTQLISVPSHSASAFHQHWIANVSIDPSAPSATRSSVAAGKQELLEVIFDYPPKDGKKTIDTLEYLHRLLMDEEGSTFVDIMDTDVSEQQATRSVYYESPTLENSLNILNLTGDFSKKNFYYLENVVGWSSITPSIPKLVNLLYKCTQHSNYSSTFEHLLGHTRAFFSKLLQFLDEYCLSVTCGFDILDSEIRRLSKSHSEPFPYYRFSEFTRLNNSYVNISALSILCRAIRQHIGILENLLARNFILHLGICSSALESDRLVEIVLELQQLQLLRIDHLKCESIGDQIDGSFLALCSNLPDQRSGSFNVGRQHLFSMIPTSTVTSLDRLTLYFVTYFSRIYCAYFSKLIETYIENELYLVRLLTRSSELCYELLSELHVRSTYLPILWSESYSIEECFCRIVMALDRLSQGCHDQVDLDTVKKLFKILLAQEVNFDSLQTCIDLVLNASEPLAAIQKLKSHVPTRGTYMQRVRESIEK